MNRQQRDALALATAEALKILFDEQFGPYPDYCETTDQMAQYVASERLGVVIYEAQEVPGPYVLCTCGTAMLIVGVVDNGATWACPQCHVVKEADNG